MRPNRIYMNQENPFLSLILPAYNAEAYLTETLDSIFSQETPFRVEVIVVNDGSTDGTLALLQDYKNRYNNLTVITTENGGPSNARNVGIQAATGEYLMFVDSDDSLQSGALARLGEMVRQSAADLLIFGFQICNLQLQRNFFYQYPTAFLHSPGEIGEKLVDLYQKNMLNQIWNKVYRRRMLLEAGVSFLPFHYGEDRLFVFEVLRHTRNLQITEEIFYNYYMRDNDSLVSKYCADKFQVCCLIDERVTALTEELGHPGEAEKRILNYMYVKSVISCATNLFGRTCPLLHAQKRKALAAMLEHPRVREALRALPPQTNTKFRLLARVLSWRNVTVAYFVMWASTKVMRMAPAVFIKAKHAENLAEQKE